ncbi:hypothetical protein ACA910_002144 [Epithemia clementina (nom. ined.)]
MVEILIFDGACRLPRSEREFLSMLPRTVKVCLTSQSLRTTEHAGWIHEAQVIRHSDFGGVTTWTCGVHVLRCKESDEYPLFFWDCEATLDCPLALSKT